MKSVYLLDTQVLIWAFHKPERLSQTALDIIGSGKGAVSAVSLWELLIKKEKPAAPIADPTAWWRRFVTLQGVEVLPIHAYHIAHLETLPPHHKDPFDRMLICQSLHEGVPLVTSDQEIHRYYGVINPVW
jgi:PIN domain nuclease of toxin-antitoxin system